MAIDSMQRLHLLQLSDSRRLAYVRWNEGGRHPMLFCPYGRMMPERVTAVCVSVAPFWPGAVQGMLATTRQGFWLARWAPWLLVLVAGRLKSNRDRFLAKLRRELPKCDRQVIDRADIQAILAENYAESVATREMGREMILLRHSWGFDLSEVRVPVELWHGELDRNVPVAHAHRLAAALPDCHMTPIPGTGHYLVFDKSRAILSNLASND